jgi:adenosylcobinamide-GDP ribazoletransferase
MTSLRQALAFLTPFPGARQPTPAALRWFPVVGALLGLVLGGIWWAAAKAWPLPVAAIIVVGADLALTGLLHLDGLADAADGLLPHLSRTRRLQVMREPTVGAFGIGVVALTLLARWTVFATLNPAPLLVAALWCVSRTFMAGTVGRITYARDLPDGADPCASTGSLSESGTGGLVSAFLGAGKPARLPVVLVGLATGAAAAVTCIWAVPAGPVAVGASVAAFTAVLLLAVRRVGGYTGDVLGAAGLIGETVGLLVAAAKW